MRRAQTDAGSQPVRNLLTNPSFDLASGTVTVRTNLCWNPRGVAALADYNGAVNQTITPNVAITGHPEGITTANRVEFTTGANPGVSLLNPTTAGTQYTISAWVYFESVQTTPGSAGFAQAGVTSTSVPMTVGVWQRHSWTYTTSGASQLGFRVSAGSGGTGSFLITGILVEMVPSLLSFFDGATPNGGDFTYAWTGATNTSTSNMMAIKASGYTGNYSNRVAWQSSAWSSTGGKSLAVASMRPSADAFSQFETSPFPSTIAGKTFTVMGILRTLEAAYTGTESRAWAMVIYVNLVGGGSTNMILRPDNTGLGINILRKTFTFPANSLNIAFIRLYNGTTTPDSTVWWDNFMVVEGEYTGDYIDGSKPFSKWDGSVDNSSSVGYPPQLLALAGAPVWDNTTTGNTAVALPGGWSNTEGRTLYTVYDDYQIPGAAVFPLVTYGVTGLADSPVNQTIMLRVQGNTPAVLNRRTGGGGPLLANVVLLGRNVACWGLTDTGTQFIQNNGSSIGTNPTIMDVPHESIRIHADGTLNSALATRHIRTVMYRGYHDDATKLAVGRYLGNKYGAPVA